MGLFETVQLELFDFMGFKKPEKKSQKTRTQHKSVSESLEDLPFPSQVIRKPHQRGLRFNVDLKGVLRISAGKSIKEPEMIELLKPHMSWIETQVQKNQKIRAHFPQKKWQNGELFPFLGRDLRLLFSKSFTKKPHIRFMENSFEYFYPEAWHKLDESEFNSKLNKNFLYFFKLKASELLNAKVNHWSAEMNLHPKSITFRNQKTRWGSCSSEGSINLNWRLAAFDEEIQNYVIIHELAHLVHQNHSKRFWDLVENFSPQRKKLTQTLNESALVADCYCKQSELYDFNPKISVQ